MRFRTRVNGCGYEPRSYPIRRRVARANLCWQRPIDQERQRSRPAAARYRRIGRT